MTSNSVKHTKGVSFVQHHDNKNSATNLELHFNLKSSSDDRDKGTNVASANEHFGQNSLAAQASNTSLDMDSTFGVLEDVPASMIDQPNTSVLHRRSSAAQGRPIVHSSVNINVDSNEGTHTWIGGKPSVLNSSVISPPIPESLPTTPGYELNGSSYFDLPNKSGYSIPHQQTVLAAAGDTLVSSSMEKMPNIRANVGKDAEGLPNEYLSSKKKLQDVSHGVTLENSSREKWRLAATVLFSFTAGLSDGAPGALLPRIEKYYGINYTVVSMIWMSNAVGYICIALSSFKLMPFFGPRNLSAIGCAFLAVMYAIVCSAPPFALVAVGFFFGGLGAATNSSFQNIFLSRFQKSSVYLGYFHGAYGLGACLGPLIATAMVNSGAKWSHFYFIMLAFSIFNTVNLFLSFKGYEEEQKAWEKYDPLLEEMKGQLVRTPDELESQTDIPLQALQGSSDGTKNLVKAIKTSEKRKDASGQDFTESTFEDVNPESENSSRKKSTNVGTSDIVVALKSPITWYLSFFVLFYQGAEVSMGGWVVTFLEVYRHGSTNTTGYVASGFWGGLTLGRLVLTPLIHRTIGAKRGVTLLISVSLVCCILAWVLPIFIAEAVFIAFFGFFTGPIYPLMVTIAVRVLPRRIQVISMTIMTALGSSGGALFPFLVGLVSEFVGTFVVMPFVFGLLSGALILWGLLPNPDRSVVTSLWQRLL